MNLKIGDEVVMNDKYCVTAKNKGLIFKVRSESHIICGKMCVFLTNYNGCFAIDGLSRLVK